jgi:putative hydrolase of the HAD superfamily
MSIEELIGKTKIGYQLIFDLDNTIYQETDFLFKAYDHIARNLFPHHYVEVLEYMVEEFNRSGRQNLFNKVLERFPSELGSIAKMLTYLRQYSSDECLVVYPWFEMFLKRVHADFEVKIITNGNPVQQKNKIASLGLHSKIKFLDVVYANETAPKPSRLSAIKFIDFDGPTIYVGDSIIDMEFARKCQFEFLDVSALISPANMG